MMRLPPFTYLQPASVDEALALARQHGPEACYVAGGTDLWPNMKRRQLSPPVVISLARLAELRGIEITEEGELRIGALTTLTELAAAPAVRERWPVVAEAAALISTPPLRNMGTIGGNLLIDTRCTYYDQSYAWRKAIDFCMKKDGKICWVAPSSPRCWAVQSSDEAPVMCAIGARLTFRSPHGGERELEADALYRDDGIAHLTKQPLELLTHITLPPPRGWRAHYIKLRRRGSFDFPVLGVAAAARFEDGRVTAARIRVGGVGSNPRANPEAERRLVGSALDDEAIAEAARLAAVPVRPLDNTDFVMGWRKKVTAVHVRRALERLREPALA